VFVIYGVHAVFTTRDVRTRYQLSVSVLSVSYFDLTRSSYDNTVITNTCTSVTFGRGVCARLCVYLSHDNFGNYSRYLLSAWQLRRSGKKYRTSSGVKVIGQGHLSAGSRGIWVVGTEIKSPCSVFIF